jgi:hypothetical protein
MEKESAGNGTAKKITKSDTLRLMARELAETIKHMHKLDWGQRESVHADLRRNLHRQLRPLFNSELCTLNSAFPYPLPN